MLAATMAELAALRVAGKETQAQIDDLRAERAATRAEIVRLNEPRRVCRRPQLLRGRGYDE
ncbi:hypothetical protein BSZ14_18700 [Sphingomonas sp. Sph1(2015)]|nr:hypothetical protein BSZ14_18700 [Sphingomonas sp. Sph1(2015)]